MKLKFSLVLLVAGLFFCACDDTTDEIGNSLNGSTDGVNISTATFDVASKSVLAGAVLSNSTTGYLGKVRDLETGNYITGDFMVQFNCTENYGFHDQDSLVTYDDSGNIQYGNVEADSCVLNLFFFNYYGDSTQTMKLTAYEMDKTMNEDENYYSDFSPLDEGYVRTSDGCVKKDKVYSLTNYLLSQNVRDSINYGFISINLNDAYTDKDGNTYNNYGTYLMQTYYDHPEYFKNSYTFRNNVMPGFFFKSKSGLGSMAYIAASSLEVWYKFESNDSIYSSYTPFWGTEEVLQTTTITNDTEALQELVDDSSCTYLKTPAGIFTELTLPVDEIYDGHETDSVSSAKLVLPRYSSTSGSEYVFSPPSNILMVQKDSLNSFFENRKIYNNTNSFVASWGYSSSSTDNGYTFSNIAGMISTMKNADRTSENWNKVVLVPVEVTTTTSSSSSSTVVTKVNHDMSLTSTRLVKGTSTDSPIQLSVIYTSFK
ncbi:MAG: DUF4270 domain-containing protein [Prevotella sp.]|jgi:hypothetical protein